MKRNMSNRNAEPTENAETKERQVTSVGVTEYRYQQQPNTSLASHSSAITEVVEPRNFFVRQGG